MLIFECNCCDVGNLSALRCRSHVNFLKIFFWLRKERREKRDVRRYISTKWYTCQCKVARQTGLFFLGGRRESNLVALLSVFHSSRERKSSPSLRTQRTKRESLSLCAGDKKWACLNSASTPEQPLSIFLSPLLARRSLANHHCGDK